MLSAPPPERIAVPPAPPPVARTPVPVAASLAPLLVSIGIWAVTGSPYSLLFAALGPIVAAGSLLDGRRQRRRTLRRDRRRQLAAVAAVRRRVEAANGSERARLTRLAPSGSSAEHLLEAWSLDATVDRPLPVRLGTARLDPVVHLDEQDPDDEAAPELRTALAELRSSAASLPDAPWIVDGRDGLAMLGPPVAARAVARAVALQLAALRSPATTRITSPDDETWAGLLPHRVVRSSAGEYRLVSATGESGVGWGRTSSGSRPGSGRAIRLDLPAQDADPACDRRFDAVGEVRAAQVARAMAELAGEHGIADAHALLPERVDLAQLLRDAPAPGDPRAEVGLRVPIGLAVDGVVDLDLVTQGPHAVIAGTTGSGKSELLVSWVLAMAARHPPGEVTFLLIDFKGGAAFAPLAGIPHVVGLVSDLDARRSARAIESLRAELRRREVLLAERGARSIEELDAGAARLVIVVDEFAAVVAGKPELHEIFADVAARGRSLGLHLVLCTQRPAGVIRDGVLANVALRISLRVTDRGDSVAMVGSDAASQLPVAPRGRAVIADGSGRIREVQLAQAGAEVVERVRGLGRRRTRPAAVWQEPLPPVLRLGTLGSAASGRGIVFGRMDLPTEQRQPLAVHDPATDGHLLILGGARAGRSTALATLAAGAAGTVLPTDPADAWTVLERLGRVGSAGTGMTGPAVLLVDDLDALIDRMEPDVRQEFVDRLARVARDARDIGMIATAQRLTGPLQRLAPLFESRLLLRQASRDELVLAGGDARAFDPTQPPGAGTWSGRARTAVAVQVAIGDHPLPTPEPPPLPHARVDPGRALAIVAGRPREVARSLGADGGIRVVHVGEGSAPSTAQGPGSHPVVLLGDPDAWQSEWSLLTTVRREWPLVFLGCSPAEVRAISRIRDPAPPLGSRPGECLLADPHNDDGLRRAILDLRGAVTRGVDR